MRNATTEGLAPTFLIRDRDEKFGATFDRVAEGAGTRVIKTAVRAPNMNPVAERFVGSLRREVLDHMLLLDEDHLRKIAAEYMSYFNRARPHQGVGQRIPDGPANDNYDGRIVAIPVLGGLHHDYRRAAQSHAICADQRGSQHGDVAMRPMFLAHPGSSRFDKVATRSYLCEMRSVGVKVLKNKLSEYLRLATSGETVLVTDRDRVVAELIPPREGRSVPVADALLAEAVRQGWLTAPALRADRPPPRLPVASAAKLLAELAADRADR